MNKLPPMAHGCITLHRLRIDGVLVGVLPEEKTTPQTLWAKIKVWLDFHAVCQSDALSDSIDYRRIARFSQRYLRRRHVGMLEKMCADLSRALLRRFAVSKVRVWLYKPQGLGHTARAVVDFACERPVRPLLPP